MADSLDEVTALANKFKDQGNACFKEKRWEDAKQFYTKAIETGGAKVAVYHNNRATVEFKLENYGAALSDASKAIEGNFPKGYYRRGQSYVALGKLDEALKDFKKAVKNFPQNKDCKLALKTTKKEIKKLKFAQAISHEQKPMSERINVDKFRIEKTYSGPQLPETVTSEWVCDLMKYFHEEGMLCNRVVVDILMRALELFKREPTIVELDFPNGCTKYTVCGDTHGQFFDLEHIFKFNGPPSATNPYVFNGDFVDRGSWSCEVILTLLCWKLACPKYLHLTRGNHETLAMTSIYGFQGEMDTKYNHEMYELCMEVFNWLPLGIVLGGKVLVVHGGIPRTPCKLEELKRIDRVQQPPSEGHFCDLVWADPRPEPGFGPSPRGVSFKFGPDISKRFLDSNGLKYLVRSHEMKQDGYEQAHDGRVITIFSAPNYCDSMGNKGAVINFDTDWEPNFRQFEAQPHPNKKPMQFAKGFSFMQ